MSRHHRRNKKNSLGWNPQIYKKIAPGTYLNKRVNQIEFDIPQLLDHLGFPPTEYNKDVAVEAMKEVVKELYPTTPFSVVRSIDN